MCKKCAGYYTKCQQLIASGAPNSTLAKTGWNGILGLPVPDWSHTMGSKWFEKCKLKADSDTGIPPVEPEPPVVSEPSAALTHWDILLNIARTLPTDILATVIAERHPSV